jgi:hypothetical protein
MADILARRLCTIVLGMRRNAIVLTVAIAVLVLAACGGGRKEAPAANDSIAAAPTDPLPPLPSAEEARALIEGSQEFSEFEFVNVAWTMPMSRSQMNEPALAGARDLLASGWIQFEGDQVVLTDKAKADRRFLARPNGFLDVVPLAKKELTEVSTPSMAEDGNARARFCFRWIANEVGSSFRSGMLAERFSLPHCGTAELQPDGGGGWEVLLLTRDES